MSVSGGRLRFALKRDSKQVSTRVCYWQDWDPDALLVPSGHVLMAVSVVHSRWIVPTFSQGLEPYMTEL